MTYEIIHHTETVKPESYVVFQRRDGRLERAIQFGKRGGFRSMVEAETAVFNATKYGTQNV